MDIKEQVLIAIYAEYQKPLPDMQLVKSYELDFKCDEFKFALIKLQNEGYIDGLVVSGRQPINYRRPFEVSADCMLPTVKGIERAERLMGIDDEAPARERLKQAIKRLSDAGLKLLVEFAAARLEQMN